VKFLFINLLVALLTAGELAAAKVFTFQSGKNGAYIRGSLGTNGVGKKLFEDASATAVVYDDEKSTGTFSAEIGAQLSFESFNLRFGLETLRPKSVESTAAIGANDQFTVTSEIFSYGPTVTLEFVATTMQSVRFFYFAGGAYHWITMDNAYAFTPAGLTTFNPQTDHTEKGEATAVSYFAGMGFEMMFADNVTLAGDFGYRYMPVAGLKHSKAGQDMAQGTVLKGASVKNADGSDREFDLSGFTVALGFRFYIDI